MQTIEELHEVYPDIVQKIKMSELKLGDIVFMFVKNNKVPCIVLSSEMCTSSCKVVTTRGARIITNELMIYVIRI